MLQRWAIIVAFVLVCVSPVGAQEPVLVRIAIVPAGARLVLDGVVTPWFGAAIALVPGRHRVAIDVPDSRCCEPLETWIQVTDRSDQRFVFTLLIRPARVTLVDAPEGALLMCPSIGLAVASGKLTEVALRHVAWDGECTFQSGVRIVRRARVRLRAGEVNAIRWR